MSYTYQIRKHVRGKGIHVLCYGLSKNIACFRPVGDTAPHKEWLFVNEAKVLEKFETLRLNNANITIMLRDNSKSNSVYKSYTYHVDKLMESHFCDMESI